MNTMLRAFLRFIKNHKQIFLLLYAIVYVPWFVRLEKLVPADSEYFILHSPIDDAIPFCEFFAIAYYAWYFYMGITIAFLIIFDGPTCWRAGTYLITGMTIFLIVCTVFPNGQDLRPMTFSRDNFCVTLVQNIYASDTPTNVLPSLHVFNSIACHLAIMHSPVTRKYKKLQVFSLVLSVLICLSTLFIKQHSFYDLLAAVIMAAVLYPFFFLIGKKKHKDLSIPERS